MKELIWDRLVVGILDDELWRKLQLVSDLTSKKAKKEIRQHEAVQEQQQALMKVGEPGTSVDGNLKAAAVSVQPKHPTANQQLSQHSSAKQTQQHSNRGRPFSKGRICTLCGRGQHPKEKCLTQSAVCFWCKRTGHYSKCFYSRVAAVTTEFDPTSFMDDTFLDTVSGDQEKGGSPLSKWKTQILHSN